MGLPHARGGVSSAALSRFLNRESSPRSWGCFRRRVILRPAKDVFPTLVGVFPWFC